MIDGYSHQLPDIDPQETREWIDSLDAVVGRAGTQRAGFLIARLLERAQALHIGTAPTINTPYVNTIPVHEQAWFPGDEAVERSIRRWIRWNAAAMVIRANKSADGIGGHLSTFASSASLYDVGFNHFFRGKDGGQPGDAVYFQGHAAPGIYARAFIEGRMDEGQLDRFRREIGGGGLSSYPHPRLMPEFWEYPTVSMGIGPINSIYHARFNKYMLNRRLDDTSKSRVWCFVGDGEVDEPETLGSIAIAGHQKLDNLIWVVNCNLQRLDGPVRGNGKIIQELEGMFRGAGWNVLKVIWGTKWDDLLAEDRDGVLLNKMNTTVDGEFQRYATEQGAYIRQHFFGPDPRLTKMVAHLSDDDLRNLPRGGHDYLKLYSAYKAATETEGRPTVILAKTIKGWTLGEGFEGRNATHQIKKMTTKQLYELRERLYLTEEIPDEDIADGNPDYYRPAVGSAEYEYLMQRREVLDGSLPKRTVSDRRPIHMPSPSVYDDLVKGSGGRAVSTTMAFTGLLRELMRDEKFGPRVVPIVPDEARTFGMDSLFREFKIYAQEGQKYEPVDHELLLSYSESKDGQILEEGITEAGSMASFIAAGTSYANLGVPMVPFFIFYSMFGFQRVGDLCWAAADSRARGFMLGATAGRTTLAGEGLQHQDGHSLILAATNPGVEAYDPAFAYELGAIIDHGLRTMYGNRAGESEDVYYYLTLYNENYVMPARPDHVDPADIVKGMYLWDEGRDDLAHKATVLFSGSAHTAAREAQAELAEHYNVGLQLWSVTSYKRLRREGLAAERWNRLHPSQTPRTSVVTQLLSQAPGPVVAVTDYLKLVPDQIARFVPHSFAPLGTDGFGRSDTREALRRFFEVDTGHVVVGVLAELAASGAISADVVADAIQRYGIDPDAIDPADPDNRPRTEDEVSNSPLRRSDDRE